MLVRDKWFCVFWLAAHMNNQSERVKIFIPHQQSDGWKEYEFCSDVLNQSERAYYPRNRITFLYTLHSAPLIGPEKQIVSHPDRAMFNIFKIGHQFEYSLSCSSILLRQPSRQASSCWPGGHRVHGQEIGGCPKAHHPGNSGSDRRWGRRVPEDPHDRQRHSEDQIRGDLQRWGNTLSEVFTPLLNYKTPLPKWPVHYNNISRNRNNAWR